MFVKKRRGWEVKDSSATPEEVFFNRRKFLAGAGISTAGIGLFAGGSGFLGSGTAAQVIKEPNADLYPAARNDLYTLDRPITDEALASTYNNFYEFGSHKEIARAAQKLKIRPWTLKIDGLVEQDFTIDFDDLIRKVQIEERLYRHRCVERWSMAVPWTGFPMKALLDLAKPLSSAKYVRMETFKDSKVAPGQNQFWYPWPYVEGVTIEEAANDLAFMVTGVYGKPLPKQHGAPLRLALPWKYGFKSIKSIVRMTFTDKEPVSFWTEVLPNEYGFYANVNPDRPHPRWTQESERLLGTEEYIPTLLFNGYGEFVADLYKNAEGRDVFY